MQAGRIWDQPVENQWLALLAAGEKRPRNGRLPRLRTFFKQRAKSQPSRALWDDGKRFQNGNLRSEIANRFARRFRIAPDSWYLDRLENRTLILETDFTYKPGSNVPEPLPDILGSLPTLHQ